MKILHWKQQSNVLVALEILIASAKECLLATIEKEKMTTERREVC